MATTGARPLGLPPTVIPVKRKMNSVPEWALNEANQSFCFLEVKRRYRGMSSGLPAVRIVRFRVDVPILIFGIDPAAAHVPLIHPSVSRQHAVVGFHKNTGRCVMIDLHSKHGTYLNDAPVDCEVITELIPGARLRFGNIPHEFIFNRVDEANAMFMSPGNPRASPATAAGGVGVPGGTPVIAGVGMAGRGGQALSADANTEASGPSASRSLANFRMAEVNSGVVNTNNNMNGNRPFNVPNRSPPPSTPLSAGGGSGGGHGNYNNNSNNDMYPPHHLRHNNMDPDMMDRRNRPLDHPERRTSLEGRSERPPSPPQQRLGQAFISEHGEEYHLNRERERDGRPPHDMHHGAPGGGRGSGGGGGHSPLRRPITPPRHPEFPPGRHPHDNRRGDHGHGQGRGQLSPPRDRFPPGNGGGGDHDYRDDLFERDRDNRGGQGPRQMPPPPRNNMMNPQREMAIRDRDMRDRDMRDRDMRDRDMRDRENFMYNNNHGDGGEGRGRGGRPRSPRHGGHDNGHHHHNGPPSQRSFDNHEFHHRRGPPPDDDRRGGGRGGGPPFNHDGRRPPPFDGDDRGGGGDPRGRGRGFGRGGPDFNHNENGDRRPFIGGDGGGRRHHFDGGDRGHFHGGGDGGDRQHPFGRGRGRGFDNGGDGDRHFPYGRGRGHGYDGGQERGGGRDHGPDHGGHGRGRGGHGRHQEFGRPWDDNRGEHGRRSW